MGLPVINITFTAAQLAAINAAITALETNAPFRVNIPADEKSDEQAMNVKRLPYVQNVINNMAPANPGMQPGFMPIADATNDLNLYMQFLPIIGRLQSVLESYMDTQWLGGVEAYAYFREFYAVVERAKNNNVPGADALFNDLKRLYEEQGGGVPTPP